MLKINREWNIIPETHWDVEINKYFNVDMSYVRQCANNVVNFNVEFQNVGKRRNNVVIFNVEFQNVGKRWNNPVKINITKNNKTKIFKIESTEFKVLTIIS